MNSELKSPLQRAFLYLVDLGSEKMVVAIDLLLTVIVLAYPLCQISEELSRLPTLVSF